MIVERTLYAVKCDKCGDLYYDKELCTSLYHAADCAESLAELEGWLKTKRGKHICPECLKEGEAWNEAMTQRDKEDE